MYNEDEMSGVFNNCPYQFPNQAAVTNAMNSGQNIDWAQLAQQWIQMRDNTKAATPVVPSIPSFYPNSGIDIPVTHSTPFDEKGEADMDMDDEDCVDDKSYERKKRNFLTPAMEEQPINSNRPWLPDKPILANCNASTGFSSTPQWPTNTQVMPPNAIPHSSHFANRPTNVTAHIPSLLSMNVPHPNEVRIMPENIGDQSGQQATMDAAKRKALPAWIREGLEKMEKEKQKQQEKYTKPQGSEGSDNGSNSPGYNKDSTVMSVNSIQTDDEDEDTSVAKVMESFPQSITETESNVEITYKSYEQKLSEMMIVVRRTLTELLLEVTNEEISKVANESLKYYKRKASSAQVIHKSALSSITSKLGLAAYDDSSSDECSDGDEVDNNSSKKNLVSESNSDSEEDIKSTVRSKRRAFAKIAVEIEERVAEAALKEEEKRQFLSSQDDSRANQGEDAHQREVDSKDKKQITAGGSGKFECESGETTETMLQTLNGKLQKERTGSGRRERTTRFSDNKDKKYVAIASSASYIRDIHSKEPVNNQTITSQSLTGLGQREHKSSFEPSHSESGSALSTKQKTTSPKKVSGKKQTVSKHSQERSSRDSTPRGHQSSMSPSSSSTSSSSSDLDSSTSNTSDNSRHSSSRFHKKYSPSNVSSSGRSKSSYRDSRRDKRDDRSYSSSKNHKDRDSYRSRYRSRSRSRSHHRRGRHDSIDSDKEKSRRSHDSRYSSSSSHSRSRDSRHRRHEYSSSSSRSYYPSSSNHRH